MVNKKKEFTDQPPQKSPESVSDEHSELESVKSYFNKLRTTYSSDPHPLDPEPVDPRPEPADPPTPSPEPAPDQPSPEPHPQDPSEGSREYSWRDPQDDLYPETEPVIRPKKEPIIDPYTEAVPEPISERKEKPEPAIDEPDVLEIESSLTEQFAKAIATTTITPKVQLLITQISDCYTRARRLMRKRKYEQAQEAYTQMLRYYHELKGKNIPDIHKHLAHHGLEELYEELKAHQEKPPLSKTSMVTLAVASVVVLLVGLTLVVNPSISGLVILEQSLPDYTGPSTFDIFGPRKIDFGPLFSINPAHLTLLATRSAHADVQVDGTSLVIIPEPGFQGEEQISVIGVNTVQEPYRMTKVPLLLVVR